MATHTPTATIHADLAAHILGALGVTTHLIHLPYGSAVHECRDAAAHDDFEAGTTDLYLADGDTYLGVCHTCATHIATYEQVRHADIRSIECPSVICDDDSAVAS